jgi:hypothetical protein
MMAGRGKLKPGKKDQPPSPASPVRSPFNEFKSSPPLPSRSRKSGELLPGLPDKTPRRRKDKSPLAKDPTTKEGTVEVPGLGSHLELPSEENLNKGIENTSTQTGAKGLDSIDKSI